MRQTRNNTKAGYLFILASLLVSACASNYGSASLTGGFREERLSPTDFWVNFSGNGYTTRETTQTYWLHRAAEVTLANGYDGFMIMSPIQLTSWDSQFDQQNPNPDNGYAGITKIVETGIDGKPFMSGRIRLIRAPLVENGNTTFNALRLKTFLDPFVKGPLCGSNVCPHVHKYLFPNYGEEPGPIGPNTPKT